MSVDGAELDVVAEGARVLAAAAEEQVTLRLLGGVAVRLRARNGLPPSLRRSYGDLDFVTARRAAFDRVLPEWTAKVSRNGVPYPALALMLIPSIPISYMYAYNLFGKFDTWTLDATLVIAITFAGSAIAAAILPWRKPQIYNASPIAKYRVLGLPLITAAALCFLAILGFALYKWFQDSVYGVNNHSSLIYMGVLYAIALLIYVVSRVYRRAQGVDLKMVYGEIPAE